MLGTMMLAGLGMALMRNPRRKKRRAKSRSKGKRRSKGWTRTMTVTKVTKMTRKNPRKGAKTKAVRVLQSYYPGAGWSDVLEEDTSREMKVQLKTYRENDPRTPYRVIGRRVPINDNPRDGVWFSKPGIGWKLVTTQRGKTFTSPKTYDTKQDAINVRRMSLRETPGIKMRIKRAARNPRRRGDLGLQDRPLASKGLTSYRLKMPHGYVMIGAKDNAEAMREAGRSVDRPERFALEVWDGSKYTPVSSNPRRRSKRRNR